MNHHNPARVEELRDKYTDLSVPLSIRVSACLKFDEMKTVMEYPGLKFPLDNRVQLLARTQDPAEETKPPGEPGYVQSS